MDANYFQRSIRNWSDDSFLLNTGVSFPTSNYSADISGLETGRLEEAERLYQRCLSILGKVLGPGHPKITSCLANYARLLCQMGRKAETARGLCETHGQRHRVCESPFIVFCRRAELHRSQNKVSISPQNCVGRGKQSSHRSRCDSDAGSAGYEIFWGLICGVYDPASPYKH